MIRKNKAAFIGLLLILFIALPAYVIVYNNFKPSIPMGLLKTLGTLISILFCVYAVTKKPTKLNILVLIALIFGIVGDYYMLFNVYIGGSFFLIGNIFYIYLLLSNHSYNKTTLYIFLPITLVVVVIALILLSSIGPLRYAVCVYIAGVIFMGCNGFTLYKSEKTIFNTYFGLGALLFTISDFLLSFKFILNDPPYYAFVNLSVYYVAQFFIAMSVYLQVVEDGKKN